MSGDTFVLRIAANDRHDRDITYQDGVYERPRSSFQAGFDCDRASTVIELAICRNERIAAGDRELNRLYGELLGCVRRGAKADPQFGSAGVADKTKSRLRRRQRCGHGLPGSALLRPTRGHGEIE